MGKITKTNTKSDPSRKQDTNKQPKKCKVSLQKKHLSAVKIPTIDVKFTNGKQLKTQKKTLKKKTAKKVGKRFLKLSEPYKRKKVVKSVPFARTYKITNVKPSTLTFETTDRLKQLSRPQLRSLMSMKFIYKNKLNGMLLQNIEDQIVASGSTIYSKMNKSKASMYL